MSLWADAVCIDQKNPAEKNVQVPLMGLIYRKAVRVVVWLGIEEVDKGLDELERIGGNCESYGLTDINLAYKFEIVLGSTPAERCKELVQQADGEAMLPIFQRGMVPPCLDLAGVCPG